MYNSFPIHYKQEAHDLIQLHSNVTQVYKYSYQKRLTVFRLQT